MSPEDKKQRPVQAILPLSACYNMDMTDQLGLQAAPTVANAFRPDERLVLLQADTQEATAALPAALFSLIISSPPYNIGKNYEKQTGLDQYLVWQEAVITDLVRLLKPGGSFCWQVGN